MASARSMTLGSKIAAALPGGTDSAYEAPNSGANTASGFSMASIGGANPVGDVTTGRITLGSVGLVVLGMMLFYVYTRSVQGGG